MRSGLVDLSARCLSCGERGRVSLALDAYGARRYACTRCEYVVPCIEHDGRGAQRAYVRPCELNEVALGMMPMRRTLALFIATGACLSCGSDVQHEIWTEVDGVRGVEAHGECMRCGPVSRVTAPEDLCPRFRVAQPMPVLHLAWDAGRAEAV